MIYRSDVLKQLELCRCGESDLDRFEQWFRDRSLGYGASSSQEIDSVCTEVEFALSRYRYEDSSDAEVVSALVAALRPSMRIAVAESDSDRGASSPYRWSNMVTAASAPVLELDAA